MTTSSAVLRVLRVLVTAFLAVVVSPVHAQLSNPDQVPLPAGRFGMTLRGPGSQIGASARELTPSEAQQGRGGEPGWLTSQAGVVIDRVDGFSPASRAGLMKGDVVTLFDGHRVRNVAHFSRLVEETPPGWTVRITIVRGGNVRQLSITPTL